MRFYYDVVPNGRYDIDNMKEDEIEKIVEAMQEATEKILLYDPDGYNDHNGGFLPLGVVLITDELAKRISLPMAKLVKCEGQQ